MFSKKTLLVASVFLVAVVLGGCATSSLAPANGVERTISVNGSGSVNLEPDMATIQIGVTTENADAAEAVSQNNTQAQQVRDALEAFGIEPKDIQTTNFFIYPQQNYGPEGRQEGVTYRVENTVMVTVRNLDNLGEILNEVVAAGANTISNISFDVEDRETALMQAMELAVDNARQRAETLAGAAEVEIGDVQTLSTTISGGGIEQQFARDMVQEAAASSVPISAGQLQINVQVAVVFELK